MSVILCPHCGTSNRVGSNFCNACGVDLRGGDEPRPPASAPENRPTDPAAPSARPGKDGPAESATTDAATEPEAPEPEAETWRDPALDAQPWLNYGFEDDDEAAGNFDEPEPATDPDVEPDIAPEAGDRSPGPRLITGVQGLLDPIRISRKLTETRQPPGPEVLGAPMSEPVALEQLRRFRNLLYEEPRLAGDQRLAPPVVTDSGLYIPWLFLLIAIVVGFPIVLGLGGENRPPEWPGVAEAHAAIEQLPPDALVLVYWAYDPATAGELNLAARPVVRHLLERRARLVGVSPLPAGPATARRVVEEIRQSRAEAGLFSGAAYNPWPVTIEYLPGGIGALPLVATAPARALGLDPGDPDTHTIFERPAALAVVLGAQAEDAQHWLEQVQARNRVPVVAVVSAGADPVLRPYLDSGQLRGLVSGFDGAFHYQARLDPQESRSEGVILDQHAGAQNWAHLAVLAALILGNLAATLGRAGRE